jgi:hypothetical protein
MRMPPITGGFSPCPEGTGVVYLVELERFELSSTSLQGRCVPDYDHSPLGGFGCGDGNRTRFLRLMRPATDHLSSPQGEYDLMKLKNQVELLDDLEQPKVAIGYLWRWRWCGFS